MDQTLNITRAAGKTKEVAMTKAKKRKKISSADLAFRICNGLFMIIFVVVTLYPVLNTLAVSLNDGTDALRGGIYLWPRVFTWKTMRQFCLKITLLQVLSLL